MLTMPVIPVRTLLGALPSDNDVTLLSPYNARDVKLRSL